MVLFVTIVVSVPNASVDTVGLVILRGVVLLVNRASEFVVFAFIVPFIFTCVVHLAGVVVLIAVVGVVVVSFVVVCVVAVFVVDFVVVLVGVVVVSAVFLRFAVVGAV